MVHLFLFYFFFFNDTATTEIYTLSLHDALPIPGRCAGWNARSAAVPPSSLSSRDCTTRSCTGRCEGKAVSRAQRLMVISGMLAAVTALGIGGAVLVAR